MTQEEKAKRYDKALERAREYKKHGYMMINVALDNIFPELKESDDERIRKALLELFSNVNKKDFRGIPTEKIIDWLERQSKETRWKPSKEEMEEDDVRRRSTIQVLEYARSLDSYNQYGKKDIDKNIAWLEKQVPIDIKKVFIGARRDVVSSIITYLDRNTLGMCLSNMECEDLENAVINSDWSKVYDYMKKKLEKQVEKPQEKTTLEAIKEEKVDNSNKVEKKFKPGDWIIHQGTGNVYQVTACIDNQYQLKYGDAYTIQKCDDVDRHARLLDAAKDLR